MPDYTYQTLHVELKGTADAHVLHVALNRPKRINAFSMQMWKDIKHCFTQVNEDSRVRCVLLSGNGPKGFTAGLDLTDPDLASMFGAAPDPNDPDSPDFPRMALKAGQLVLFAGLPRFRPEVPCACGCCSPRHCLRQVDIRIASPDVRFSIREVLVGMAADVGTLQFFPLICGSDSVVRELCYTGRDFGAEEAKDLGFVSKIEQDALSAGLKLCEDIASNSPVAVVGIKHVLEYGREAQTAMQLKHNAVWNQAMILGSRDMMKCVVSSLCFHLRKRHVLRTIAHTMSKKPGKPRFSKL
ncbi:putative enoyl CoA hydratase [Perkinsus olseni]|uniref:Putative enoyl CoA hydratase n=1 Tax=Perkinsus olseni TaxID=32597 RepID=A0A7J6PN72_PEROL|nr:putative enoyl CoA hydratase [Perkinsus olseni]